MSRNCLPACGIALVVSALSFGVAADDKQKMSHEDCAKACSDCQRACDICLAHCTKMLADGKHEHLATLRTCQDCSTICSSAASIVARKGPYTEIICMACVDACKQCGIECDKQKDDATMKRCAEECHKCEKVCADMLNRKVAK